MSNKKTNYSSTVPNTMAIITLAFGFLSLTLAPCVAAIPAVIFGHISIKRISRGEASGREFALIGMIMGYISLICSLICFAAIFAYGIYAFTIMQDIAAEFPK